MKPYVYGADTIADPPDQPTSPTAEGYPTQGVPGVTPATHVHAWWFYAVGREIYNLIVGAGLTPSNSSLDQVKQSVLALIGQRMVESYSFGATTGLPFSVNFGPELGNLKLKGGKGTLTITATSTPGGTSNWAYTDVTFEDAFDSYCLLAFASPQTDATGTSAPPSTGINNHEVSNISVAGFRFWGLDYAETGDNEFRWLAIGV